MGIFGKRKPAPALSEPLRTGIFRQQYVGAGLLNKGAEFFVTFELAEWERLGNQSRVTVIDVSGVEKYRRKETIELLGNWVPTWAVTWREEAA